MSECTHDTLRAASDGACPICVAIDHVTKRARELPPLPDPMEYRRMIAERARAELRRRATKKARASFAEFVKQAWHVKHGVEVLEWGPHLQAICDTVQRWLEGWLGKYADGARGRPRHVQNLKFNLPPGTLKSEIIMVFAPAWLWLHSPRASFGCISGNPDNVTRDSNACRDLVQSPWFRDTFAIAWRIREDVDAVARWVTTAGGERVSRGISASSVGLHVDILLIDDPDDAHKVHSDAHRRDVKSQISALGSRLKSLKRSLRGLVQQRVHADDSSASLNWPALVLPATFRPDRVVDTPWGRVEWREQKGEPLHPRLSPDVLAAERLRLGSAGYSAQYEQDPEEPGGNMFKRAWWRFFYIEDSVRPDVVARPKDCSDAPTVKLGVRRNARNEPSGLDVTRVVLTVDATFGSMTDAASRVGMLVVAVRGADRFVLADRTRRMTYPETEQEILRAVADYPQISQVLVEKKANGAAILQRLGSVIGGLLGVDPEGGKESRAAAMSPSVEAGNWYLLEGAPWLDDGHDDDDEGFMAELSAFPNGKKDDRVDALSQLSSHYQVRQAERIKSAYAW